MKILVILAGLIFSSVSFAGQASVETGGQEVQGEQYLSYNFGTVWTHTRQIVRFNVTNTGETPLTFKSAVIYGADFGAAHSCKNGLQPKEKCFFEIEYWPMFEGTSSGRFILTFVENDQIVVDLWGTARKM